MFGIRIHQVSIRLFLTVCTLLLALVSAAEAQVRRLSLNDALSLALEFNRELKVAKLEREKSGQSVREAWGNVYPALNLTGQFAHSFRNTNFFIFPAGFGGPPGAGGGGSTAPTQIVATGINSINATLQFTQPIYRGAIWAGIRASSVVSEISEEAYINERAKTITEVKKAYYDVLIAQESAKLIEQSIARNELALQDVRQLYKQGLAADIDTLRAFVAVENLRPQLIKALNGVETAKIALKVKIGLPANETLELTDSLTLNNAIADIDFSTAYQEALAKRPEVRQLQLQVRASEEQVAAEFSNFLPTLDAFVQAQVLTLQTNFNIGSYQWGTNLAAGLQLSVPIFSGFRNDARLARAELERQQTQTNLENLQELIRSEISISLSNVLEAKKRIAVQATTVQSAERSYAITRSRRQQGIGSQLELTDAELSLNQAKVNYLQAVYDYLVATANLEKALGRAGRIAEER
ncbi:MAG: TolC family protein [Candidatus Thermochlorobacter sp.]